jgi:hypothetical protein
MSQAGTSGDIAINASGTVRIAGAGSIAVNGFWTYHGIADPVTGANGHQNAFITQAYLDGIDANDSRPFMQAAWANGALQARLAGLKAYGDAFHLRPGVQIVSATQDGDLTVAGDIDLAAYRYGPTVNPLVYGSGEPGSLVIRAGGDLNIYGSMSDGFARPPASSGDYDNGWRLLQGTEPFSQDVVVPAGLTIGAGTTIPTGNISLNYDVPLVNVTVAPRTVLPTSVTLGTSDTVSASFVATSAIRDAGGAIVFAKGQKVPAGTVLRAGWTIERGGVIPDALQLNAVIWPAGASLAPLSTVSEEWWGTAILPIATLAQNLALKPGSLLPAGTTVKFDPNDPNVIKYLDADGNPLLDSNTSNAIPWAVPTRPTDADGTQGKLYALSEMLPAGSRSWSMRLVSGADTTAADTRQVKPAGTIAATRAGGNLTLSDTHYAESVQMVQVPPDPDWCAWFGGIYCLPSTQLTFDIAPAHSVLRTGTGDLDLIAGGNLSVKSL